MEPFELLLHQEVLDALRRTRGENRRRLNSLFSVLPTNPHIQSDGYYEDQKDRIVQQLRAGKYVIDDPMRKNQDT